MKSLMHILKRVAAAAILPCLAIPSMANSEPEIDSYTPNHDNVHVNIGATQTFSVQASDEDGDALTYSWEVKSYPLYEVVSIVTNDPTGSFVFGPLEEGTYSVECKVTDGNDEDSNARQWWNVTVSDPLPPPVIETKAFSFSVPADETISTNLDLKASGGTVEGEWNYEWCLAEGSTLPEGMHLDSDGEFWAELGDSSIGVHTFDVVVYDLKGMDATATITVTVTEDPNHTPVIDGLEPMYYKSTICKGATKTFSVRAHDPDGDKLAAVWILKGYDTNEWSYVKIRDLAPQADGSVLFPADVDVGEYRVECIVSDGAREDNREWDVDVVAADAMPPSPVIETKALSFSVATGENFYTNQCLKASGGTVEGEWDYTWRLAEGSTLSEGMHLDSDGEFWADLTDSSIGVHTFDVVVYDLKGMDATATITVTVTADPNHMPVIDGAEPVSYSQPTIRKGTTKSFSVRAHDPDGDKLATVWTVKRYDTNEWSYVKIRDLAPQADGSVLFPADVDVGEYRLECTVSDGARDDSCYWYVDVVAADAIVIGQDLPHAVEGQPYTFQLTATGGTAPYTCWEKYDDDDRYDISETGVLSATITGWDLEPGETGALWCYIGVKDSKGKTAEQGLTVLVESSKGSRIQFDPNGGAGSVPDQGMYSGANTNLSANVFTRDGFVFLGWSRTPDGPVEFADRASVKDIAPAGTPVTLYAKWAMASYTVTFAKNGGKGKMKAQALAYGTSKKLKKNKFTRKGYVFAGWALSKKGTVVLKDKASMKTFAAQSKTVTLYARWAKPTYKVKFYSNGGKGSMAEESFTFGKAKKLSKNKFTKKGYKFQGWAKSKKGAAVYKNKKKVKNLTMKGKTVKLYAVWVRR